MVGAAEKRCGDIVARGSLDKLEPIAGLDGEFWRGDLVHSKDVPGWIRYPSVLTGYRRAPRTWRGCLRTLFQIHNETGNIWTHVLAGAFSVYMFWRVVLVDMEGTTDLLMKFILGAMIVCSLVCYVLSVLYHLFGYMSRNTYRKLYVLDQKGVLAYVAGSHAGAICFLLQRRPLLRLACLGVTFGVFLITQYFASYLERYNDIEARNNLFLLSVLWAPCTAFVVALILDTDLFLAFVPVFVICYSLNFLAFLFFTKRWPEVDSPGKFDLFLHSHQLWHVIIPMSFTIWTFGLSHLHRSLVDSTELHVPATGNLSELLHALTLFTLVLMSFIFSDLLIPWLSDIPLWTPAA